MFVYVGGVVRQGGIASQVFGDLLMGIEELIECFLLPGTSGVFRSWLLALRFLIAVLGRSEGAWVFLQLLRGMGMVLQKSFQLRVLLQIRRIVNYRWILPDIASQCGMSIQELIKSLQFGLIDVFV